MRVVFDTNIIIAGTISPNGASYQLLNEIINNRFKLITSVPLMLEYEDVLKRKNMLDRSGLSNMDIDVLLNMIAKTSIHQISHFLWRPQWRDAKDEMVLETAINGEADAIITFNKADFESAIHNFGIKLLTSGEFLRSL